MKTAFHIDFTVYKCVYAMNKAFLSARNADFNVEGRLAVVGFADIHLHLFV